MAHNRARLEKYQAPVAIKLALLWASLMFLYIYNDYFALYMPGTIQAMSQGRMGPLGPATPGVMVAVSMLLAVPAAMIFLSAALPPMLSKWLNVFLGLVYTAVEALTFAGPHLFYKIVVAIEIVASLLIVFYALRWPKQKTAEV